MAINQKQVLSLQQKLSPQQIQMIKLLELPAVQLEQRIKQEIEDNIVLEEEERSAEDEEQPPQQISFDEYLREDDTPSYKSRINNFSKDDKQRPVYLTEGRSLQEYLVEQLGYRNLPERDMRLATRTATCAAIWSPWPTTSPSRWGLKRRPGSWNACSESFTNWSRRASARATCANACCCRWRRCRSTPVRGGWPGRF